MRAYADSSFLVKLLAREAGSEAAVAEYRRLGLPRLFFVPLHALEVENAIRQKAFHQRRSLPSSQRGDVEREKATTLARLRQMIERGLLLDVAAEWDDAMQRARELSRRHAESTGARSLDLLHVAFGLELQSEWFLTTEERQAEVARAEGLKIVTISDKE